MQKISQCTPVIFYPRSNRSGDTHVTALKTGTVEAMFSKHLQKYLHGTATSTPCAQGPRGTHHPARRRIRRRRNRSRSVYTGAMQQPAGMCRCAARPPSDPAFPGNRPPVPPGQREGRAGRATCGFGLLRLPLPRQAGAHEGPGVLLDGELLKAGGGEPVHLLLALRPATQRAGVRPSRPAAAPRAAPAAALTRCGTRRSAGPCARRRTCCGLWERNTSD